MGTKTESGSSDYDRLTPERWTELVNSHVANLENRVNEATRKAVREYLVMVFRGAKGTELKFIEEVLDRAEIFVGINLLPDRKGLVELLTVL